MADDGEAAFKKAVEKVLATTHANVKKDVKKQVDPLTDQLDELQDAKKARPDQKKQEAEINKKLKKLILTLQDDHEDDFKKNILQLDLPKSPDPKKPPVVAKWLDDILGRKLPINDDVTLHLDADVDWKAGKLKSAGLRLEIKLGN